MPNKLISGQQYKFSDFFSGDKKVVIPDLQRDYCWGGSKLLNNEDSEIVSAFFESLYDIFENSKGEKDDIKDTQLGMVYAYSFPDDNNNIQLCDGQQRLTTLYLLIGMLYKKSGLLKLKDCLISNRELENENKEPRLQYAIRDSTLYFLSDLVCKFFLQDDIKEVSFIKESNWYLTYYETDPTIHSMIEALKIIEKKLNANCIEFSNYILENIYFFYFDMGRRKFGEKMFVTINTTGEPLTNTENLKPLLIGNIEIDAERKFSSDLWEGWEKWFWQNRFQKLNGDYKTDHEADNGLNDFLTWTFQIKEKKDSINLIKIFRSNVNKEKIEKITTEFIEIHFLNLLKLITHLNKENSVQELFKSFTKIPIKNIRDIRKLPPSIIQNILLPLLAFMVKISNDINDVYIFLRRLRKNYFHSIWEERINDYLHWRYILNIIENSKTLKECLKYESLSLKITNEDGNEKWFNAEEALKVNLRLIKSSIIDKWEDHEDFMGDLTPLFKVCNWSTNFEKNEDYFNSYLDFITPTDELKNEISLIKICSDSQASSFSVYPESFTCINRSHTYKIFNKNWFIPIWKEFTDKKNNRLITLRKINQSILSSIIKNQICTDEFLLQLVPNDTNSISQDEIKNFETIRITESGYWGGYIVASIYYWMYLENLYKNDQDLSIKNELNQIGLKLFDEIISDDDKKYSFSNIKVGTHKSSGNFLNQNYDLMFKINDIQKKEIGSAFESIDKIMDVLRSKITAQ